jgi:hypothetical protein
MAIEITEEQLLCFGEAAKLLPPGSRPSYTTFWRWWRHGVNGVKLETVRVGGKRFTTAEAMQRFVATLTARDLDQFPASCSSIRRDRDRRAVENELRKEGIL